MQMRVIESRNDAASFEINDFRARAAFVRLRIVDANDASVIDGEVCRLGILRVESGDTPVVKNQVCIFFVCWCHNTSSESSGQCYSTDLDEFAP